MAKRILVVDDEESMRITIEACLEDYEVELASSGSAALLCLASSDFDLVLCDLMMPEMSGAELFETIALDSPLRTNFIFMSGGSAPPQLRSFVALAGLNVLAKPFTVGQLREVVAEHLAAREV